MKACYLYLNYHQPLVLLNVSELIILPKIIIGGMSNITVEFREAFMDRKVEDKCKRVNYIYIYGVLSGFQPWDIPADSDTSLPLGFQFKLYGVLKFHSSMCPRCIQPCWYNVYYLKRVFKFKRVSHGDKL